MTCSRKNAALVHGGLLLLFIMAFQGRRGVWHPDEGRYCAVALQMVRSNDYVHIRLHPDVPHYTKPPLTYWLLAASFRLFGVNEFAARLPNALALWATCLLLWRIGKRVTPDHAGLAPLVYATSALPIVAAYIVTTDTILTLMEVMAVSAFLAGRSAERRSGRCFYHVLMWLGFGLAFLTKGPPGLLPLLSIVVFSCVCDGFTRTLWLFIHPGIAVFAVVGLGWFYVVIRDDPSLLTYFLRREVADRIVSDRHQHSPQWYGGLMVYVPFLLLGCCPWVTPMLRAFRQAPGIIRRPCWAALRRTDPMGLFVALWFLLPVAVLTCARSRMPLYLLPFMAPVALWFARSARGGFHGWPVRAKALLLVWCCFAISVRFTLGAIPYQLDCRPFARAIGRYVTDPFNEILFVDSNAWYGLSLYLDCDMKRITALSPSPDYATVGEELRRPNSEQGRLFIVKGRNKEHFLSAVADAGCQLVRQGEWEEYQMYLLRRPSARTEMPKR